MSVTDPHVPSPITVKEVHDALNALNVPHGVRQVTGSIFVQPDPTRRRLSCTQGAQFVRRDRNYSSDEWNRLGAEFEHIVLQMAAREPPQLTQPQFPQPQFTTHNRHGNHVTPSGFPDVSGNVPHNTRNTASLGQNLLTRSFTPHGLEGYNRQSAHSFSAFPSLSMNNGMDDPQNSNLPFNHGMFQFQMSNGPVMPHGYGSGSYPLTYGPQQYQHGQLQNPQMFPQGASQTGGNSTAHDITHHTSKTGKNSENRDDRIQLQVRADATQQHGNNHNNMPRVNHTSDLSHHVGQSHNRVHPNVNLHNETQTADNTLPLQIPQARSQLASDNSRNLAPSSAIRENMENTAHRNSMGNTIPRVDGQTTTDHQSSRNVLQMQQSNSHTDTGLFPSFPPDVGARSRGSARPRPTTAELDQAIEDMEWGDEDQDDPEKEDEKMEVDQKVQTAEDAEDAASVHATGNNPSLVDEQDAEGERIHEFITATGQKLRIKRGQVMQYCAEVERAASRHMNSRGNQMKKYLETKKQRTNVFSNKKRGIKNHLADVSAQTNCVGFNFLCNYDSLLSSKGKRAELELLFTSFALDPMLAVARAVVTAGADMLCDILHTNNGILKLRDQSRCTEDQRRQYVAHGMVMDGYLLEIVEEVNEKMLEEFPDPSNPVHGWYKRFQDACIKDTSWKDYDEFSLFYKGTLGEANEAALMRTAADHFERFFEHACRKAREKTSVSANVIMQKWAQNRTGIATNDDTVPQEQEDVAEDQLNDEHDEEFKEQTRRRRKKREDPGYIQMDEDWENSTVNLMGALDSGLDNGPSNNLTNQQEAAAETGNLTGDESQSRASRGRKGPSRGRGGRRRGRGRGRGHGNTGRNENSDLDRQQDTAQPVTDATQNVLPMHPSLMRRQAPELNEGLGTGLSLPLLNNLPVFESLLIPRPNSTLPMRSNELTNVTQPHDGDDSNLAATMTEEQQQIPQAQRVQQQSAQTQPELATDNRNTLGLPPLAPPRDSQPLGHLLLPAVGSGVMPLTGQSPSTNALIVPHHDAILSVLSMPASDGNASNNTANPAADSSSMRSNSNEVNTSKAASQQPTASASDEEMKDKEISSTAASLGIAERLRLRRATNPRHRPMTAEEIAANSLSSIDPLAASEDSSEDSDATAEEHEQKGGDIGETEGKETADAGETEEKNKNSKEKKKRKKSKSKKKDKKKKKGKKKKKKTKSKKKKDNKHDDIVDEDARRAANAVLDAASEDNSNPVVRGRGRGGRGRGGRGRGGRGRGGRGRGETGQKRRNEVEGQAEGEPPAKKRRVEQSS